MWNVVETLSHILLYEVLSTSQIANELLKQINHSRASFSLFFFPFQVSTLSSCVASKPVDCSVEVAFCSTFSFSVNVATKLIYLMTLENKSHRSGWQVTCSPVTMVIKNNLPSVELMHVSCVLFIHYIFPFLTVTSVLMIHWALSLSLLFLLLLLHWSRCREDVHLFTSIEVTSFLLVSLCHLSIDNFKLILLRLFLFLLQLVQVKPKLFYSRLMSKSNAAADVQVEAAKVTWYSINASVSM